MPSRQQQQRQVAASLLTSAHLCRPPRSCRCAAAEDVLTLQAVLEATSNAHIASHILHILFHCLARPDSPDMSAEQMQREPGWGGWALRGGGGGASKGVRHVRSQGGFKYVPAAACSACHSLLWQASVFRPAFTSHPVQCARSGLWTRSRRTSTTCRQAAAGEQPACARARLPAGRPGCLHWRRLLARLPACPCTRLPVLLRHSRSGLCPNT